MAEQGFRITYATMTADNEELHKLYDQGIEVANVVARSAAPAVRERRGARGQRPQGRPVADRRHG